jgi:hypothetical protein
MKENIKVLNQRVVKKWKRIWKYWIKDLLKMKENMKVFKKRFVEKWKRIWKFFKKDLLKNEREYERI